MLSSSRVLRYCFMTFQLFHLPQTIIYFVLITVNIQQLIEWVKDTAVVVALVFFLNTEN